ncbi:hypothetical protein DFH27DRAFT_81264 [Peziza echinospora]|nr:hypothetical protein DFH27DRAFT_81264 [Peziza echinospora]
MGKAAARRNLKKALSRPTVPYISPAKTTQHRNTAAETALDEELQDVDVAITIETLNSLLANPALLRSPAHKETRTLIHKLHALAIAGTTTPLSSEDQLISALRSGDHPRARLLLSSIKSPKLGALQRWVRECDAANMAAVEAEGTDQQDECWRTLEAIIRTTTAAESSSEEEKKSPLIRFPAWQPPIGSNSGLDIYGMVRNNSICSPSEAEHIKSNFRVLTTIPGEHRKPPNVYPAIIWTSTNNAIPLVSNEPIQKFDIPDIPNAIMLTNVIPKDTCRMIVAAGETVGYTPDQAAAGSATELASILAHNFYWMADEAFSNALFDRVKPFLPETIKGLPIKSLNRRYRCYRYVPGAVYRPHVDGAWPPSGISADGEYIYNASPPGSPQYSRFTFLIYLNDEFDGGETTFFVPSESPEGGLCVRSVKPRQGSVVVFPHGDTAGSLVHEGSGVKGQDGTTAKYIIRTDVIYEIPKTGRAAATSA